MIRLNVVDRDDNEHALDVSPAESLMEALRIPAYGVAAICGGLCSCATCHVYISPEWVGRLDPQQSDERDLLSGLQYQRETSRLSCQVKLSEELNGLRLAIAPEE